MFGNKNSLPSHKLFCPLRIESLAPRLTLDATASASAAIPWLNLGELTYSFTPDGTTLAHSSSSLFSE